MRSSSRINFALPAAIVVTGLALAACGTSSPSAGNTSKSPAGTKAACTVEAAMVPIRAAFNQGGTHAVVFPPDGGLKCASGIARISVLIGPVNAPANGPQGTDHLVLLEDQAGQWVIANDKLCDSSGYPTRSTPPELGLLCGFG